MRFPVYKIFPGTVMEVKQEYFGKNFDSPDTQGKIPFAGDQVSDQDRIQCADDPPGNRFAQAEQVASPVPDDQ